MTAFQSSDRTGALAWLREQVAAHGIAHVVRLLRAPRRKPAQTPRADTRSHTREWLLAQIERHGVDGVARMLGVSRRDLAVARARDDFSPELLAAVEVARTDTSIDPYEGAL